MTREELIEILRANADVAVEVVPTSIKAAKIAAPWKDDLLMGGACYRPDIVVVNHYSSSRYGDFWVVVPYTPDATPEAGLKTRWRTCAEAVAAADAALLKNGWILLGSSQKEPLSVVC